MRELDLRWIVLWLGLASWTAMGFAWSDNRQQADPSGSPEAPAVGAPSELSATAGKLVR